MNVISLAGMVGLGDGSSISEGLGGGPPDSGGGDEGDGGSGIIADAIWKTRWAEIEREQIAREMAEAARAVPEFVGSAGDPEPPPGGEPWFYYVVDGAVIATTPPPPPSFVGAACIVGSVGAAAFALGQPIVGAACTGLACWLGFDLTRRSG